MRLLLFDEIVLPVALIVINKLSVYIEPSIGFPKTWIMLWIEYPPERKQGEPPG
jgi:hypothetical protein